MSLLQDFAPAKINLCLHVTGRRADGYHLLDSLVVFAGYGDEISAKIADSPALMCKGPFGAEVPEGADNLVLRAAKVQAPDLAAAFTLTKNLPPASGIGGGSSDAAAAVRLMARLDPKARPLAQAQLALLGADIPVCLAAKPARMRGVGEELSALGALPSAWMVLVNPRVEVPTPAVFRALQSRDNAPLPAVLPQWGDLADFVAWLSQTRNDLEAPAISQAAVIAEVRAALSAQGGCLLARMSGSGATCFGLFAHETEARAAADAIARARPEWWAVAAQMLD